MGRGQIIDLTGKEWEGKFGRWKVLERAQNNSQGQARFLCECTGDVKNPHTPIVKTVSANSLKHGRSLSCGCLKKEQNAERCFKDLMQPEWEGKFGCLTILSYAGKNKWGNALWVCSCSGSKEKPHPEVICKIASGQLIYGRTRSCGCSKIRAVQERSTKHERTKRLQSQGHTIATGAKKAGVSTGHLRDVLRGHVKTRKSFPAIGALFGTKLEEIEERKYLANVSPHRRQLVLCACCGTSFLQTPCKIRRHKHFFLNAAHYAAYRQGKRPEKPVQGIMWDLPKPPKERKRNPDTVAVVETAKLNEAKKKEFRAPIE